MPELAPAEVLELLDAGATIQKRAQWECFEFTLLGDSDVEVVNASHEEPKEHTYTVHAESGIPSDCTCPAFEYQEGSCKHMVAVAIREPVLEAVNAEPTVKADGGVTVEADGGVTVEADGGEPSDERPDDCDCTPLMEDLSCWPCYRDGFEEPNPDAEVSDE